MAETRKTKAANTARPKKTKAAPANKAPAKKVARKPTKKAAPRKPTREPSSTFDVTKLIDHPLVADLLAVGAMAAVAAIADHGVKTRTGEAQAGSSKAVKAVGMAAAAAIGKRLMTEVDAIKKASGTRKPAKAKRGSR